MKRKDFLPEFEFYEDDEKLFCEMRFCAKVEREVEATDSYSVIFGSLRCMIENIMKDKAFEISSNHIEGELETPKLILPVSLYTCLKENYLVMDGKTFRSVLDGFEDENLDAIEYEVDNKLPKINFYVDDTHIIAEKIIKQEVEKSEVKKGKWPKNEVLLYLKTLVKEKLMNNVVPILEKNMEGVLSIDSVPFIVIFDPENSLILTNPHRFSILLRGDTFRKVK